jgi:hypothetical protein
MINVLCLLEKLGQDARLRGLERDSLSAVLERERIDPAVRAAILDQDQRRLEALLGSSANVCCMIHAPDEEEKEDDGGERPEPADDDDKEDAPNQTSSFTRVSAVR